MSEFDVTSDYPVAVGLLGNVSASVKNVAGSSIYYGDPAVTSSSNFGTLAVGSTVAFTQTTWLRSAGRSTVTVTWTSTASNSAESVNTVAASGSTLTIPTPTANSVNVITLTANCTLTFPSEPSTGSALSFTLVLIQDGTGGRIVTWPTEGVAAGDLMWAGKGGATTLSAAAGAIDVFTFTSYGSGWLAFASGLNMG
jgi:hypothetical protein